MEKGAVVLFILVGLATSAPTNPPSRFQADKFLDMLARTFDPKIAYQDLLTALQKRLNLNPVSNITSPGATPDATGSTGVVSPPADPPCPDAEYRPGSTITYSPTTRAVGSRAFYECNKGFTGRSLFIQCMPGGQWSPILGWEGCKPVTCGPPPQVANADASATSSTFGSTVSYICRSGYKMSLADANLTCQGSGQWSMPSFKCDMVATPAPPPAANNGMNMAAMAALMSSMSGGEGGSPAGAPNPMLAAMMKGMPGMGGFPMMGGTPGVPTGGNTNIMDMMKMMAGGFPAATPAPPTTTPAPPKQNSFQSSFGQANNGFQLPTHLKNLLPNGLSNAQGFKPQDLVALSSAGLGSANRGPAGFQDITSLLSSMNPMAMLSPGGLGGQSPLMPGGRGRQPVDPEKMAEQREEMMMRAMMTTAFKSMMGGGQQRQGNGTNNANNGNGMNNMLAMMALQNGLGGAGGGGAGGMESMIPMMMNGGMGGMGGMMGAMGGMGGMGGGAGLLSGLLGGA